MAEPTESYDFATDAAYDADAAANKIDLPSILREEGFERGEEPGAQHMNHLLNSFGKWLDWLRAMMDGTEDLDTPPARTVIYHPSIFRPFILSGAGSDVLLSVAGAGTGYRLSITDSNVAIAMPLNGLLPFGAGVTSIDLLIRPSTKSTTGRFSVHAVQPTFDGSPAIGSHTEVAFALTSGTTLQKLTLSTGFAIGNTFLHYLVYTPGTITGTADLLEALRIQFTDPGPRNF